MFASNFGYDSGGVFNYSDIYSVETGTSPAVISPSLPVPPVTVPAPPAYTPPITNIPVTPAVTAPQAPSTTAFIRTLSQGMKGTDVVSLQQFLFGKGLLVSPNITGFFGPITRAAVQRYQCQRLSVCSGSESTTGYGLVGPRTRAAIATDI